MATSMPSPGFPCLPTSLLTPSSPLDLPAEGRGSSALSHKLKAKSPPLCSLDFHLVPDVNPKQEPQPPHGPRSCPQPLPPSPAISFLTPLSPFLPFTLPSGSSIPHPTWILDHTHVSPSLPHPSPEGALALQPQQQRPLPSRRGSLCSPTDLVTQQGRRGLSAWTLPGHQSWTAQRPSKDRWKTETQRGTVPTQAPKSQQLNQDPSSCTRL